jgi:hypothetical protein
MSLLGINVDKSLAPARLENKALGYVEGSDERLLKELGILTLEKGVWKLKHRGEEVAEFLNWIANGKPKGTLPSLAKAILCQKRATLARGIKDAGTSTYARSVENRYVAEIDAIFASTGTKVECALDAQTRPSDESAVTGVFTPLGGENGNGPEGGIPKPSNGLLLERRGAPTAPGISFSAPVPKPTVRVDPFPANVANVANDLPQGVSEPAPNDEVPGKKPTIAVRADNSGARESFTRIISPALADILQALPPQDETLHDLLGEILKVLHERQDEYGFAKLIDQLGPILQSGKPRDVIIREIGRILNLREKGEPNDPINPREWRGVIEEVVEKRLQTRRHTCSDKIQCLQQLVYTTCGEASLLDPLIDHLQKLLAAFSSLPVKNSRVTGLQDSLTRLEEHIRLEASNSALNANRSSLKAQLSGLDAQLASLNSPPNSPMTGKTADMEASAQERGKRRIALQAEIQKIQDLLSAQGDPEARRAMMRSQLFEEQELLDSLLRILPDSDTFLPVAEGYKSDLVSHIRGIDSISLKALESACNARSYTYRQQLLIAREEIERLKTEELERQKTQFQTERASLLEEKDGVIKGLEERLARLEEQRGEEYTVRSEDLKRHEREKTRLEDSMRSATERAENALRGKANVDAKISTLEAIIASLKTELGKRGTPSVSNAPLVSNNAPVSMPLVPNSVPLTLPKPLVPNSAPAPMSVASTGSVRNRIQALRNAQAPKSGSHRGPGFRGGSKKARGQKSSNITRKLRK